MRRAKRIIFALAALGEATQPPAHAQRADPVTPAGQYLVRVTLVPNVPHQPVVRRIKHIMDRGGQLDHTQPRSQMSARRPDRRYRLCPQLICQLA